MLTRLLAYNLGGVGLLSRPRLPGPPPAAPPSAQSCLEALRLPLALSLSARLRRRSPPACGWQQSPEFKQCRGDGIGSAPGLAGCGEIEEYSGQGGPALLAAPTAPGLTRPHWLSEAAGVTDATIHLRCSSPTLPSRCPLNPHHVIVLDRRR
jgi:hypothetical protein